jgi:ADP-heptose:LPS heptosyltransferase
VKILVVAFSGVGDTLIATPFIHELRAQYPAAELHVLVRWPGSKDLLEGNPHLNRVHQKDLIQIGMLRTLPFLWRLRRLRFDLSINVHTQGRVHYRIVAGMIGARLRLSHQYENHSWLDRFLVHRALPQDYTVHSVENNLRLLRLLDREPLLPRPELEVFLAPAETQWSRDYLAAHQLVRRRRIGIHVGSGATKNLTLKRWPLDHYIALLRRFTREHPETAVLLFGGPEERSDHARILEEVTGPSLFAPETKNLRQAGALLKQCHGFLSVDTALMHLAAAVKVPRQVVIEAPTLNPTNLPWQNPYRLVRNPVVNGRNLDYYRYDGKPIKGTREELRRCMASVKVEDVYGALTQM